MAIFLSFRPREGRRPSLFMITRENLKKNDVTGYTLITSVHDQNERKKYLSFGAVCVKTRLQK
jgi:hypothetical protein